MRTVIGMVVLVVALVVVATVTMVAGPDIRPWGPTASPDIRPWNSARVNGTIIPPAASDVKPFSSASAGESGGIRPGA